MKKMWIMNLSSPFLSSYYSFSHSIPLHKSTNIHQHNNKYSIISCAVRRHLRPPRHRKTTPLPPSNFVTTPTNPNELTITLKIPSLNQFNDALEDLKTLVSVDETNNVVIKCRRPTLVLLGKVTLGIIIFVFLVKMLFGSRNKGYQNRENVVYRRDRSLGGKQVLVGRTKVEPPRVSNINTKSSVDKKNVASKRLPSWWPVSLPRPVVTGSDKQEYQKMADRMIRAILDQRIMGNDISEHDIVQFRRLCRGCGVSVFIETANARDSFYRAAVDFVLKVCESVDSHATSVNIDGEDAQQFVAGIAGNIGVEDSHAATIATAAIAARTRSCFLQAWALEMQGKHSEAVAELSKICLLHRIFPPEENSPEMEMVARGLEKNLKLEQRESLMGMLAETCNGENHRSAAEALGLVSLPEFGISREAKLT